MFEIQSRNRQRNQNHRFDHFRRSFGSRNVRRLHRSGRHVARDRRHSLQRRRKMKSMRDFQRHLLSALRNYAIVWKFEILKTKIFWNFEILKKKKEKKTAVANRKKFFTFGQNPIDRI